MQLFCCFFISDAKKQHRTGENTPGKCQLERDLWPSSQVCPRACTVCRCPHMLLSLAGAKTLPHRHLLGGWLHHGIWPLRSGESLRPRDKKVAMDQKLTMQLTIEQRKDFSSVLLVPGAIGSSWWQGNCQPASAAYCWLIGLRPSSRLSYIGDIMRLFWTWYSLHGFSTW